MITVLTTSSRVNTRTFARISSLSKYAVFNRCANHVIGTTINRRAFLATHNRFYSSASLRTLAEDNGLPVPSDAQKRTIYALATPSGKGGVAVIRVSGPEALAVYQRMVRPYTKVVAKDKPAVPSARKMIRCTVYDPDSGEDIDDGLAVFFPAPRSFTTEDVLELHVHSGRAIISSVLGALARLSSPSSSASHSGEHIETKLSLLLRPAERGEFTRRAFLGGRLDLTQAEALRDLVDAETDAQRRTALRVARGSARERFEKMRTQVIRAMAMTEALIDFGEGEDIEEGVYEHARQMVHQLQKEIAKHLDESKRGEILRSGLHLTIFGPPNVGKSSLLNSLAGREAAIVTSVPGTTRDVLEITLDFNGLAVIVADTAGIRKTEDVVEQIGVERAHGRVAESDVSLCVLSLPDISRSGISSEVKDLIGPATSVLLNKADLTSSEERATAQRLLPSGTQSWVVSLVNGEGLEEFMSAYSRLLSERYIASDDTDAPLITQARHRMELENAQKFLAAFLATDDVVIAAEELRYAANAIGKITGAIDVEDVLDVVFREFCIGK